MILMKTPTELEQAILCIIRDVYDKCYNKTIEVIETFRYKDKSHLGYILKLSLNKEERPFSIAYEGDDEGFLNFVKDQLRLSRLADVDYFEGERL